MNIRFLRHATLIVDYDDLRILVDPMLSPAGAADPIPHTHNQRRNPLIDLPLSNESLFDLIFTIDTVLITHTHSDHWDKTAQLVLPRYKPIYCQPEDQEAIQLTGFSNVQAVKSSAEIGDLKLIRTGGQHGTGELAQKLGPVSGFVLRSSGCPSLYIAGDTIWCDEVDQTLRDHRPDIVIVNAGGARFIKGDPITMTASDVARVCEMVPAAIVIAVHMEAINHCELTRGELREYLETRQLTAVIPEDGQILTFPGDRL